MNDLLILLLAFICTLAVFGLGALLIWCESSGVFCKLVGHNEICNGWTEENFKEGRKDGLVFRRTPTSWYCLRCRNERDINKRTH